MEEVKVKGRGVGVGGGDEVCVCGRGGAFSWHCVPSAVMYGYARGEALQTQLIVSTTA